MDCKTFWIIIAWFLVWAGQQINYQINDANQQIIPLVPANYGAYTESLIQYVINHNEEGSGAEAAQLLRGNMAQYAALAAGAAATQFFDRDGNTLFDITRPESFQQGSEEATLWGELKGLWQTMNTEFMNANFMGKMLALMQIIGILKCAKWCWTTASDCVLGAIDLGKWSYNMLAGLVRGPLSTTAPLDTSQIIPNQRFKNAVNKVITQNTIISFWLGQVAQGQGQVQVDTLNDILTQIDTNAEIKKSPTEPMDTILLRQYQQQQHQQQQQQQQQHQQQQQQQQHQQYYAQVNGDPDVYSGVNINGTDDSEYGLYNGSFDQTKYRRPSGGRRSKRRRNKSSKRRTKSRSSKKRRHYKTKKRVYRSTRFRTHR